MMRSMAASMASSGLTSVTLCGFEFGDRLVGEPDLVGLAAVIHADDDFHEPIIGDEIIGDRACAAKIVRGDRVSVANHAHTRDPNPALDQHGPNSSGAGGISAEAGTCSKSERAFSLQQKCNQNEKAHRPGRPMRQGNFKCEVRRSSRNRRLGLSHGRRFQSRYRIWSVQNRSSRCSDLFSVANSSFEMPPTCSTVLTCFCTRGPPWGG